MWFPSCAGFEITQQHYRILDSCINLNFETHEKIESSRKRTGSRTEPTLNSHITLDLSELIGKRRLCNYGIQNFYV